MIVLQGLEGHPVVASIGIALFTVFSGATGYFIREWWSQRKTPRPTPYPMFTTPIAGQTTGDMLQVSIELQNLGNGIAQRTRTWTEIYIGGNLVYKSDSISSSDIPPGIELEIGAAFPARLLAVCDETHQENELMIFAECECLGNRFRVCKKLYYHRNVNRFSGREDIYQRIA